MPQETELSIPSECLPDYDKIVTEDDAPVDSIYSEKQQRFLAEPLHSSWSGHGEGRPFVAFSNVGLFYMVKQPPLVPDMLLSVDVSLPDDIWQKQNRSYFLWEYGKPPEVVVEVVSNKQGDELTRKKDIYARISVLYYVVWDPDEHLGEKLTVFQLQGRKYRRIEKAWFPEVDLGVTTWQGRYEDWDCEWLRWCDAAGTVIPSGAERAERERQHAERERQHAERERQHAERERQHAERERERADQLASDLARSQQEVERLRAQLQAQPPKV